MNEKFQTNRNKGPINICDICIKLEYDHTGKKLKPEKYQDQDILEKCRNNVSNWICHSCDKALKLCKMPVQAQTNGLKLCPKYPEIDDLEPLEKTIIKLLIPFMFIVPKHRGAQYGLKGQCVLVPAKMKKIQMILPRVCNDEFLISLALKRRLTDLSAVTKMNIRPAFVNRGLEKYIEVNHLYSDVSSNTTWESESQKNDPELWSLLTDDKATPQNDETDSDEEIEGNDARVEREQQIHTTAQPTLLQNVDGPDLPNLATQQVNIAPCENEIPVSFYSEPDWEALAFPEHFSTGQNHFNSPRESKITPIKYAHARLKCVPIFDLLLILNMYLLNYIM